MLKPLILRRYATLLLREYETLLLSMKLYYSPIADRVKAFTDALLRLKNRDELCNLCIHDAASECFEDDKELWELLLLAGQRWDQLAS